jgi:hypothetical protein
MYQIFKITICIQLLFTQNIIHLRNNCTNKKNPYEGENLDPGGSHLITAAFMFFPGGHARDWVDYPAFRKQRGFTPGKRIVHDHEIMKN